MRDSPRIAIAGAGLVGSLLAVYLARRGHPVRLFERRPDMRKEAIGAGRSINLAVSTRGLHALREIGLEDEILAHSVPMTGRMIHAIDGSLAFQRYGKDDSECIHSISRGALNKSVMTAAEKTGTVSIDFHARAVGADFARGIHEFRREGAGVTEKIECDLLFGADGSASGVRAEMAKLPGFSHSESILDYGYKEFHIPPGSREPFQIEKNVLHIWPRGTFMLIALPNFDGSFTCTLFLPLEGSLSFAALKEENAVLRFFGTQFPDVVPLLSNVVETFFGSPTGQMTTVKCSPWTAGPVSGPRALLIGDAAHAIVPFFGQGMNCGFEDCSLLDAFIGANPSDWPERLSEFAAARRLDTDAIADMAIENFVEMRDKVADPRFQLEKAVEKILQKEFPGQYLSRYSLVTFSRVPYRIAAEAGRVEDGILSEFCAGIRSAQEVDLERARKLIDDRLKPVLEPVLKMGKHKEMG